MQSIVLDDNRSQHSGEDGSNAMDYLNEGAGDASSRRSSLTDIATEACMDLNANKQQEENNSYDNVGAGNDDITSKLEADAKNQVICELKQ